MRDVYICFYRSSSFLTGTTWSFWAIPHKRFFDNYTKRYHLLCETFSGRGTSLPDLTVNSNRRNSPTTLIYCLRDAHMEEVSERITKYIDTQYYNRWVSSGYVLVEKVETVSRLAKLGFGLISTIKPRVINNITKLDLIGSTDVAWPRLNLWNWSELNIGIALIGTFCGRIGKTIFFFST